MVPYKIVQYHTPEWNRLVESEWITMHIDQDTQLAMMLKLPDQIKNKMEILILEKKEAYSHLNQAIKFLQSKQLLDEYLIYTGELV